MNKLEKAVEREQDMLGAVHTRIKRNKILVSQMTAAIKHLSMNLTGWDRVTSVLNQLIENANDTGDNWHDLIGAMMEQNDLWIKAWDEEMSKE